MSQQDTITERIRFLREGGEVLRCHTHGSPDPTYNVARHTFNVVNLLLMLHPDPSVEMIKAAMWHDAPERMTGDIPAVTKWESPELTEALRHLENRIMAHYGLETFLDDNEQMWVKCCDRLELYLWASEQWVRGDNRFDFMRTKLLAWFESHEVPLQVNRVLEQYNSNARCVDVIPPACIPDPYPSKELPF